MANSEPTEPPADWEEFYSTKKRIMSFTPVEVKKQSGGGDGGSAAPEPVLTPEEKEKEIERLAAAKLAAEKEPVLVKEPLAPAFQAFVDWCLKNGVVCPKLALVQYGPDYRGVETTGTVTAADRILFVPDSIIITAKKVEESPIGKAIIAAGLDIHAGHYLSMFLLQEQAKKKESKYYPWLQVMPSSFKNIPMFWSPDELAYLKGSIAVSRIEGKRKDLKEEWSAVRKLDECKNFSWKQFCWARGCVMSRTFGVSIGDREDESALVPFADMMTKWTFDEDAGGFTLNSWNNCGPGTTIHESYGKKSNLRFLLSYGFCMVENKNDEVMLAPLAPLTGDEDKAEEALWTSECSRVQKQLRADEKAAKLKAVAAAEGKTVPAAAPAPAPAAAAAAAAADAKSNVDRRAASSTSTASKVQMEDDLYPLRSRLMADLKSSEEEHMITCKYRADGEGVGKVLSHYRLLHARNDDVRTAAIALAEIESEEQEKAAKEDDADAEKEPESSDEKPKDATAATAAALTTPKPADAKSDAKSDAKVDAKSAAADPKAAKSTALILTGSGAVDSSVIAAATTTAAAAAAAAASSTPSKKLKLPPPPFPPVRPTVSSDTAAAATALNLKPSAVLIDAILSSKHKDQTPALSIRNELATLRALERTVLRVLTLYPNPEADDQLIWAKHEALSAPPSATAIATDSKTPAADAKSTPATAPTNTATATATALIEAVGTAGTPSAAAIAFVAAMKAPLSWNVRNAILLRMGEKSILRRTLPFVRDAIALYALPYMHLKARKIEAVNAKLPTATQRYAMEVAFPLVKKHLGLGTAD